MRKKIPFLSLLVLIPSFLIGKDIKNDQYRRNSLCSFFLSETKTDVSATSDFIVDAMNSYVFPDKFNNHDVDSNNIIDLSNVPVEEKYRNTAIKKNKMGLGKALGSAFLSSVTISSTNQNGQTKEIYNPSEYDQQLDYYRYDLPARIMKYVDDSKLANKLVAKWFNASSNKVDGSFYNMDLIQERGAYNASELDKLKAKEAVRGHAILEDAGMELIPNTYLTFTVFEFYSLSKMLEDVRNHQNQATGIKGILQTAKQIKGLVNSYAGKTGYNVIARTYLFKLDWDKNTEETFLNKYWGASVEELLYSNDFHLRYMGFQKSSVWYSAKSENTFDVTANAPMVSQATNRAIDECLSKLMEDFEDFRVKAPLIDVNDNNISAFIGAKEGITKKSNFEVLEKEYDPDKNQFRYHKIGTLKVDKNRIWDDRFTIDGVITNSDDDVDTNPNVDRTYFIGKSDKLAPGMLIRQTK